MIQTTLRCLLAIGAFAVATTGCGPSYMLQVNGPTLAVQPTATEAVVVFIRGSGGDEVKDLVMDSTRHFLGNALLDSHFAVRLPPGDHTFVLWSEGTFGLKAHLAAGKTYFVEIHMPAGNFVGMTPRSEGWAEIPTDLKNTTQYVADQNGGQKYLDERGADANGRIAEVTKIYAALPADAPPAIGPDDGIPRGEDIAAAIAKSNPEKKPHPAPPKKK